MQFIDDPKRTQAESIVPMINVVFLLLIFFLMTAEIAPPEPFPVTPPTAESDEQADGVFTLFINPKSEVAYQDTIGPDAALAALGADLDVFCEAQGCSDETPPPTVLLRADANASAAQIAALLSKIGALGFRTTHLITGVK